MRIKTKEIPGKETIDMVDVISKKLSKENKDMFFEIFGISILEFIHPMLGFDIFKFDDYLKNTFGNYEDGKTSMKDFINRKYGQKAVELIEKIM